MSQSVLTNTAIAFIGRVINVTAGIAVTAALTRYLGTGDFGTYTLLLSLGSMLLVIADFGLYLTLSREIAQHPQQAQTIFAHIFSLRLALLVIVLGVGLLAAQLLFANASAAAFAILALGFAFQSVSQLLMAIHQARGVMWRATAGDLIGRLVQLGGILIVFFGSARLFNVQPSPLFVAVGFFTLGTATALCLHRLLIPAALQLRFHLAWGKVKPLLAASWPLALMLLLNVIYFRVDVIILSLFRSADEVGWYGLAYKIVESALFFPAMFGGLLLPVLSAANHKKNLPEVRRYLQEALRLTWLAGVFTLAVLLVVPAPLVAFLSGLPFLPAAPLLQILSLALFVMFFGNIFGFALIAFKRQRLLLKLYAALAALNLIGNLLLIPRYGALAAAWTTVATEAIAASVAGLLVWKIVSWPVSAGFVIRALAAGLATAVILYLLPAAWHILWRVSLTGGAFVLLSAGFGLIQPRRYPRLMSRYSALP